MTTLPQHQLLQVAKAFADTIDLVTGAQADELLWALRVAIRAAELEGDGWIACTDRLPDSKRFVIGHFPRASTCASKIVIYDGQQGWRRWEDEKEVSYPRSAVTRWHELPSLSSIDHNQPEHTHKGL